LFGARGNASPIISTNKKEMTKKLKGIPAIRYNNPGGRPPVHDFSILEVNEGIETTISGVVCAKRYGRLSGRKFTQRKIDGKYYIYRVS